MTDSTKMVDLPWVDGTTRTVPEWTPYKAVNGYVFFARDGGYSSVDDPKKPYGDRIYQHHDDTSAVRIFAEAPEPPVKVDVPTGIGAVVSIPSSPHKPGYALTRRGWSGLAAGRRYAESEIADELRAGARVLFEGVAE